MKTLIFDTETSGFYDSKLDLDHPNQGRVLQLACVLLDDKLEVVNSFCSLIKQDEHVIVHPGAQDIHGISKEMCQKYGIDMDVALKVFYNLYNQADVRVAHNIKFDSRMLDTEMDLDDPGMPLFDWNNGSHICTMREMTPICKLPGNGKFKWPKLQEAYYHIFSKNFDDAHDALADVMAASKVFKWLVENGHVVLPKAIAA